ncbi:hypothetical protein AgCh_027616 [Apium graveolens]
MDEVEMDSAVAIHMGTEVQAIDDQSGKMDSDTGMEYDLGLGTDDSFPVAALIEKDLDSNLLLVHLAVLL